MVEADIITKIVKRNEWVTNMVVVKTIHYPIPTADEFMNNLQGFKMFTFPDAKNGFWQWPLNKESCYRITFSIPRGRFRFLVLSYCGHSNRLEATIKFNIKKKKLTQTSMNYLDHVL